MKQTTYSILIALAFLMLSKIGFAQNTYSEFKSFYKPTQQLLSPDNIVVYEFQAMDMARKVKSMEEYVKKGHLRYFSLIIISIDRYTAGVVLDKMNAEAALKGLAFLADKWALEVVYYVSENTFNNLSALSALKNYKGLALQKV